MKIFSWSELDKIKKFTHSFPSAITIGGFDGPHLGHKVLFDKVLHQKGKLKGVITFDFTEEFVKHKDEFSGELSTVNQKLMYFEELGFDFCLLIDFSTDFSKIKGIDFLKIIRESCSMQFLAVGFDFRCGYQLDTGVAEISAFAKQFGLELAVCEQVLFHEQRISSSDLRQHVKNADFSYVNELLLFPFALDASSFEWRNSSFGQSEKIANSKSFQVLPKNGIYNVKVFCTDEVSEFDFTSVLHVESNFLRLEIPLEYDSKSIKKIIFIC